MGGKVLAPAHVEMSEVLQVDVRGLVGQGPSGPEKWGDLLDLLETGEGLTRRVVTAVRFDGVAVPTFRAASALGQELRGLGPIEVEATTVDALVRECARAALDSTAPLKSAVIRIVSGLRGGDTTAAQRELGQLTSALHALTSVTAMLADASRAGSASRPDVAQLVQRLTTVVDAIIAGQTDHDAGAVADALAAQLLPALQDWSVVLRRMVPDRCR
jgi:hypothetical protein